MLTDENFAKEIEMIRTEANLNYIESILLWCERKDAEIESVVHMIKKDNVLRLKLKEDGIKLHLVNDDTGNTLPL